MTSDREFTNVVRSWMHDEADVLPERIIDDVLARVPSTRQNRPLRLAWKDRLVGGTLRIALAAVAVLALVALAYGLFRSANIGPATTQGPPASATPTPSETPTTVASPAPTDVVLAEGVVAYPVCNLENESGCSEWAIWIVNADGTNAREILADLPGSRFPVAWSPDGTRLLYSFEERLTALAMTDAQGATPDVLTKEVLCPAEMNDCELITRGARFSPDGDRLAYWVFDTDPQVATVGYLTVLDLTTDVATRLDATRTSGSLKCCDDYYLPSWSPDGERLTIGLPDVAIATINADGSGFRRLDATEYGPKWSPDGSLILVSRGGVEPTIFTIEPDVGEVLTTISDGTEPHWTRDGRIVFRGANGRGDGVWQIDADGRNAAPVGQSVAELTSAGCIVCPVEFGPDWTYGFWQPIRGGEGVRE